MLDRTLQISTSDGTSRLELEHDWTPIRIIDRDAVGLSVIWAKMGFGPFDRASYEAEVAERMRTARWFVGPFETLVRSSARSPGIPLRGIVWHLSRCGSTLARNLLAATDGTVALGEPGIFNQAIQMSVEDGVLDGPDPYLGPVLRSMVRPHGDRLTRYYVKATSFTVMHIEKARRCCPELPMIFIHRDPREVLASLMRSPPDWLIHGIPEMEDLGIPRSNEMADQGASILVAMLRSAMAAQARGTCRLVAYPDLPDRMIDGDLPAFLGYEVTPETRDRMWAVARFNSKRGEREFGSDSEEKRKIYVDSISLSRHLQEQLESLHEQAVERSRVPT